jgi:alpha-1,3-rhamnosyl/mannosyltransferase
MRVSVDCSPLLIRCAGMKSYLYHFARNLLLHKGRHEFRAFPFLDWFGGLDLLDSSIDHERSMIGRYNTTARLLMVNMANKGKHSLLDWAVPGVDLFYATNHVRNPPRRGKLATTLHDLTTYTVPECHPPSHREMENSFIQNVVLRADAVIAISEHTRQDLIRIFDFPPERVEVIYQGIADAYFATTPEGVAAVRARYGLDKPYILHVGTIEPRKNINTLFDAYERLKPSLREAFPLVLAGPIGWADAATIRRVQSPPAGVRYLGYLPEGDLPFVTAGATVCVYPSLYEGFGLPVPQAMASGVAVLTSNVSSLPEVAGDAAILVDPRSQAEIAAGIERLLTSPSLREDLIATGRQRVQRFRWDRSAKQTWDYFERVCGG